MLTPEQCREVRRKSGLSQYRLARALGLSKKNGDRSVRRFEAERGEGAGKAPEGPTARLYQLILAGRLTADDLLALAEEAEGLAIVRREKE